MERSLRPRRRPCPARRAPSHRRAGAAAASHGRGHGPRARPRPGLPAPASPACRAPPRSSGDARNSRPRATAGQSAAITRSTRLRLAELDLRLAARRRPLPAAVARAHARSGGVGRTTSTHARSRRCRSSSRIAMPAPSSSRAWARPRRGRRVRPAQGRADGPPERRPRWWGDRQGPRSAARCRRRRGWRCVSSWHVDEAQKDPLMGSEHDLASTSLGVDRQVARSHGPGRPIVDDQRPVRGRPDRHCPRSTTRTP